MREGNGIFKPLLGVDKNLGDWVTAVRARPVHLRPIPFEERGEPRWEWE